MPEPVEPPDAAAPSDDDCRGAEGTGAAGSRGAGLADCTCRRLEDFDELLVGWVDPGNAIAPWDAPARGSSSLVPALVRGRRVRTLDAAAPRRR